MREDTKVCSEQFGFRKKGGRTDAVFALHRGRSWRGTHGEELRWLYVTVIDSEKACDWAPEKRGVVVYEVRGSEGEARRLVQDMCREATTRV